MAALGIEYKDCSFPIEAWESVVVQDDRWFDDRTTIYYHCSHCGEDFAILEFGSGEILYIAPKLRGR